MTRLMRPLGVALLAFLAGLLPSLRLAPEPLPLVAVAVGCSAAVLWVVLRGSLSHDRALVAAWFAFTLAGLAAGAAGAREARTDCRTRIPDGSRVSAEGVLGAGIAGAVGDPAARAPILPLARGRVSAPGTPDCAGEVRLRLDPETPPAPAGTRIRVSGEWVRSTGAVVASPWPGEPRYAGYLIVDSIVEKVEPQFLRDPLLVMRGATEAALRDLFPGHAPVAEALLLGRRERLDPALTERFARSGLIHLLAISGSHVGLFAAMLLIVGSAIRLPRSRLAGLCIGTVAVYLGMIGAPPSAVRAGIMLSLALLAVVLQRGAAAVPVLSAAAILILSVAPRAVLSAGFQLSFAGVIGILLGRRLILNRLPRRLRRSRFGRPLIESLTISTAAFLATAPIVAHHFGQLAPVGIAANLVAVPATAVALSGVIGAVALYPLLPALAHVVADGAAVALEVLDRAAVLGSMVPLGHVSVPRPDWAAWVSGIAIACLGWWAARRLRPRARAVAASGAAAALLLAWPALARGGGEILELHFLDVGQGDALAIRTPADRWLLVDAGPRGPTYDAGARRILPFLHAHRVPRLEALILTHPDADHIGGAPSILRGIPVGSVVDPGLPVGKGLYAEVLAEVERAGIPWIQARAGDTLRIDGLEILILWPEPDFLDPVGDANQISTVLLVRFGDFEVLLTGDAPADVERRLVRRHGSALRAEVLKAGHHGSWTSTSSELLQAVRPELVVIPVGRRNRYGHPAPEVVGRITRGGIPIARTDRDGTVTLRIRSDAGGRWVRSEP